MALQQTYLSLNTDERAQLGYSWFQSYDEYDSSWQLLPLFADASFRRYFRLLSAGKSLVLLDSPPDLEPLQPFVDVARQWRQHSVRVPQVIACHLPQGFALLEDLGDRHLESVAEEDQFDYYTKAIDQLLHIQNLPASNLPLFNSAFIGKELSIMLDWTLPWLQRSFNASEQGQIDDLFQWLAAQIAQQPWCVIHRDYHCRNLMMQGDELAVIDFQGAMIGPWSYDVVSLLSDACKDIPANQLPLLYNYYLERCALAHSGRDFYHDCMVTQLQRHIKILGIFCRLSLRDGKHQYLQYLAVVCRHICFASERLLGGDCQHDQALSLIKSICQSAVDASGRTET